MFQFIIIRGPPRDIVFPETLEGMAELEITPLPTKQPRVVDSISCTQTPFLT